MPPLMWASPSSPRVLLATRLVAGDANPRTSAVSGVAGDEPWTKSSEVDSFDLGFDPPRVTDAWAPSARWLA